MSENNGEKESESAETGSTSPTTPKENISEPDVADNDKPMPPPVRVIIEGGKPGSQA